MITSPPAIDLSCFLERSELCGAAAACRASDEGDRAEPGSSSGRASTRLVRSETRRRRRRRDIVQNFCSESLRAERVLMAIWWGFIEVWCKRTRAYKYF